MISFFRGAAVAAVIVIAVVPAATREPVPIAEDVGALALPLAGVTVVRVEGLHGTVRVAPAPSGEATLNAVVASGTGPSGSEVSVDRDDRRLVIRAAGTAPGDARTLELRLPDSVSLEVVADDTRIESAAWPGDLDVSGARLDLDLRGPGGTVRAEIQGGKVRVEELVGDLGLTGSDVEARIRSLHGLLTASLTGGTMRLTSLQDDVDLDVVDGEVSVRGVAGEFRLRMSGGSAAVEGLARGGEISLKGTPLQLTKCRGSIRVDTDSQVRFHVLQAALYVDGLGASVQGVISSSLVEVKTHAATVKLNHIKGPVRVQGDGLDVQLERIDGEIYVAASTSTIDIRDAAAPVTVDIERGDVSIYGGGDEVTVFSRDGNVRLEDMSGPVYVEADGDDVAVGWRSLDHRENSQIYNDGGDVSLRFPAEGACRVEASSGLGGIDSDLEDVEVLGDGTSARGWIRSPSAPIVYVESAGRVLLRGDRPATGDGDPADAAPALSKPASGDRPPAPRREARR